MLTDWCDSRTLCDVFNRMTTHGDHRWWFRDLDGTERCLRMTWDDPDPDAWVVINRPAVADEPRIDPTRTVVFHMEPRMWSDAMRGRWGTWSAPSPRSYLQVRDLRRYRAANDWWVGLTYDELRNRPLPEKTATLAACVSEKYFDPGHRRRIDFLRFAEARDLVINIFGSGENGFRQWRGRTPLHDKRAALLPYRYYFDAENHALPNFVTEKLVDCLLAETLCFYWGAPNVDSFVDPRAFVRLTLDDFEADLARIRDAIANDEWSERLPYIRAEKQRILEDLQFFPTLARVLDPARRRRRWTVDPADDAPLDRLFGSSRGRTFVEISDRADPPEVSETVDVERRLDWAGLCLEADADRRGAARRIRDCIVAPDDGGEVAELLWRNGLQPDAIEWLNLAVERPAELLRTGGRLDPATVRANVISMPRASPAEQERCVARLEPFGYELADVRVGGAPALVRRGREAIYGFYHLCTINTWREVLAEQLGRWSASGLADATERIFVSIVGPDAAEGRAMIEQALGPRLEVVLCRDDASEYERPILRRMRSFCADEQPLARAVWYMHAKGVSTHHCGNPNVADWRRYMEHFVVDGWRQCTADVREVDVCGVNWRLQPEPHFSGNFWWAAPSYVATLPDTVGPGHHDPEMWIGSNQPLVRCRHESGVDHYADPFPPTRYETVRRHPTVCLNMIVRDEAHVVTEALASAAPHVDSWVVVDTGSTDGTQDVIRDWFANRGIPGKLHERPWVSFAHNRTEALDLCRGVADYAWVLDADDRLEGTIDLSGLTADSYAVRFGRDFTYWRDQIFATARPWRFEGVVHEYAACPEPVQRARLDGDYHVESRRLGARGRRSDTYARDAELLRAEHDADPEDPRTVFYLAQSLLDAGDTAAALAWYRKRVDMAGWDEERFYAALQVARCLDRLDAPEPEVVEAYLRCADLRPTRAEPWFELAARCRRAGRYDHGYRYARRAAAIALPEQDALFVAADVHRWRAADELSISAFLTGRHRETLDICGRLLDEDVLPESERERVAANHDLAVPGCLDDTARYPAEIVERLCERSSPGAAAVTLTITSCRRFELFERTVSSFLRCCEDLDRIDRWVCVDDGSSEDDRRAMAARFGFFEFIWKEPADKGHAASMNLLREQVATPYWLHLEDDWHFFARARYVERALAVLDDDATIGQVLLNRNYGETLADRTCPGGDARRTGHGDVGYLMHQHHRVGTPEYDAVFAGLPAGTRTHTWWPHFSLRPSLMRTAAIRAVGPFDRDHEHFELDFARRYTAAGNRTASLDRIHCLHTGPLTSDRRADRPPNAYALNDEPQFGRTVAVRSPSVHGELDVRVINLDRRPDRWEAFVTRALPVLGADRLARLRRVTAVDGTELDWCADLEMLFRANDFGSRRGVVGCALSHLGVWRDVAAGDVDRAVIFEDDAELSADFLERLDTTGVLAGPLDHDVILLGHSRWDGSSHWVGDERTPVRLEPMDWSDYLGGLFAYVVTRRGAARLAALAARDGIGHGIDRFVHLHGDALDVMRCTPGLARSGVATDGSGVDSDVQYDDAAVRGWGSFEPSSHRTEG